MKCKFMVHECFPPIILTWGGGECGDQCVREVPEHPAQRYFGEWPQLDNSSNDELPTQM
jgi:hypothetical protein